MQRLAQRLKKVVRNPLMIFYYLAKAFQEAILKLPYFHFIRNTKNTETPITFSLWFSQKVLGRNKAAYWPMHSSSVLSYANNVYAGIETCPGYNPGCYVHAVNGIYIGDYTQIAPNVGLMSGNHDLYDFRIQTPGKPIRIGKYCWLGMGVVILPEVELGDFTIVGAGAIVTKSFPEGHCVIVGNPANVVKYLDKEKCVPFQTPNPYNGYIPASEFSNYRAKYLNV